MGLIEGIKNFFSFDSDNSTQEEKEVIDSPIASGMNCSYCELPLECWDKRKTFMKQKFHVKCFRKLKKECKKDAFG